MWVKICASTTLADARLAAEAGADAVGFVFAPSKRQVTAAQVREMVAGLPASVEKVGVFGDLPAVEIAQAAQHAGLTAVQLHGGFNRLLSAHLRELLGPGIELLQTVHWSLDEADAEAFVTTALGEVEAYEPCGRVLVDARVAGASGGLGVAFDWVAAGRVLARRTVILAGGLRADNVAEAVRTVRPWGVDVASGVESSPGVKDPAKVRAFIENAWGV